ncbi:MAG: GNAT family N-acetyltransferase [Hyphomicrobium sp.]
MTALLRTADFNSVPRESAQLAPSDECGSDSALELSVRLVPDISEIEAEWRALEAAGSATLFQSYDWVRALCNGAASAFGEEPLIVAGYDARGAVAFIWPMAVSREMGVKVLTWLGSWCSSSNFGIYSRRAAAASPAEVVRWIKEIARLRPDLAAVNLGAQPQTWNGLPNPILNALRSGPSGEYERTIPLTRDFQSLYAARFSSDRRSRIRRQEKKLASLGRLEIREAKTAAEHQRFLDTFLMQKRAQLAQLRAPAIYSNPAIRPFLEAVTAPGGNAHETVLLTLELNDDIAATRWGFSFNGRFYAYGESLGDGPARQRSPGTLITIASISRECANANKIYDFGPGPGEHKDIWHPVDTPLMNSWMILRPSGALPVTWNLVRSALKGQARARPKLLDLWRDARFAARGVVTRLRGPSG